MPITARLSREFYDRFGDKIVNELVGLLNSMDATFRLELRDFNEQNFRRFDAKLEQRIAELRADLRTEMAGLASALRAGMSAFEAALRGEIDTLRQELREEIAGVNTSLRQEMATGHASLHQKIADVRQEMASLKAELIKWMFLFWLGTMATMFGMARLLPLG